MMRKMWRRFRPKRSGALNDKTLYEQDTVYTRARLIVDDALREARNRSGQSRSSNQTLNRAVRILSTKDAHTADFLLAKLLLMTPGAARAQHEMDHHHGGYKNRQARLFELIDFNDAFVDTVLALDERELAFFSARLWQEMKTFCHRMRAANFEEEQYQAIVHGLSREIAVYRGAKSLGYIVRMTSRSQDAMGIDMVIIDPETKKSLNVDIKTNSSFHFRLLDLIREKRMDEEKRMYCELAGYCTIRNGSGVKAVDTVLFRVATKYLGPIQHFSFAHTHGLAKLIREALDDHGVYINNLK